MVASSPKTPTARIALIGCGMWGRNIARNLHQLGVLAGVSDLSSQAAGEFAAAFETEALGFDEILDRPDINGVCIVTAAPTHAQLALDAFAAGKAVYVEKPLSLTVSDAEAMVGAAEKAQKPLMVGHLIRHHAGFQELCRLIKTGAIGGIRHLRLSRIAPGRIRDSESVLFDLCPHDLALVAALTDQAEPTQVHCHGFSHITPDVHDSITAQLDFKNGMTASIQANWLNPVKIHNLTVIGDTGALVFDDTKPWAEKLTRFTFHVTKTDGMINLDRDQGEFIPLAEAEPLKDEMQNFIDAITTGQPPLTDGNEALYVQHIMARMQASLDQGTAT